MLKLKHSFHLPHLSLPSIPAQMQFQPVHADNDELSLAIETDAEARDDVWKLTERPDTEALAQFWTDVESDVAHDPEWFKFSED